MGAKNKVIAGDYEGKAVDQVFGKQAWIVMGGFKKPIDLDKNNVNDYEIINEDSRKSLVSAVGRGFVGALLIGPVGMLAGLSAKNKGVHVVAVEFKDGKKSLLEVNDKIYAAMMKGLF